MLESNKRDVPFLRTKYSGAILKRNEIINVKKNFEDMTKPRIG